MNFLLDTHALLWWRFEPARLSSLARLSIEDERNRLFWSAASTWETAIKSGSGRLTLPEPAAVFLSRVIQEEGLVPLSINHQHAAALAELPRRHKDPFDRMLVVQARIEGLRLLSADPALRLYDVDVAW